jgi:hypothetical protein
MYRQSLCTTMRMFDIRMPLYPSLWKGSPSQCFELRLK